MNNIQAEERTLLAAGSDMISNPSPEVPNVGGEVAVDDFTKRRKGSREAEPGHNAETIG